MKGPMVTQTLQDIIGKEPHHWRGDRDGLEEFNPTFTNLQGADAVLTVQQMQEFEDFLATITIPPNPSRNFDNSLPAVLPLPGHYTTGIDLPAGQPLPDGRPVVGPDSFASHHLMADLELECRSCHTMRTGQGPNSFAFQAIPPGPNGELHHGVVFSPFAETTNISIKIPQLRNLHEKQGFDMMSTSSRAGFGFLHDGSVDTLERFMSEPAFAFHAGLDDQPDQMVADMVAFMLTFSGSDLPLISNDPAIDSASQDTHAAVGAQLTMDDMNKNDLNAIALLTEMMTLADAEQDVTPGPEVGLVAKGLQAGVQRGYVYVGDSTFQADRWNETRTADSLRLSAAAGAELTFTVVPRGTEIRIGVDRDQDGFLDRDELDACSDPEDFASIPAADLVVPLLELERPGSFTRLTWNAVGASFDVIRGSLSALHDTGGDFAAAVEACLEDNLVAPVLAYPDGISGGEFFLVSADCAGGTTYESGGPGQQGLRNAEIVLAAGSCPE
jgi:hypothetical protein